MPSSMKAVCFGGKTEEVYDYQKQEFATKSVLYVQTALSDLTRSCGVEVVHSPCEPQVIASCMTSDPVHQSYTDGFRPFIVITKSKMFPGAKNKPAFREFELSDAFPSPKHVDFPILPTFDINPLYRLLELPDSVDADAVQRLAFGIVVGTKKYAIDGNVYITCNMLEPVDAGATAFGYSVLYASATESIYNHHMKLRGKPQIVLFNGYNKIGKNHTEAYHAVEHYTLEDVEKLLATENSAGGSPLPPVVDATPASESPAAPSDAAPADKPKPAWMAKKSANPDTSA